MANDQKQDINLGIRRFEYGDPARPFDAVLTIKTTKHYDGGLASTATVFWTGLHARQHMFGIGTAGGDFDKGLRLSARTVKATQRAIDRQHAEVFTPEVIARLKQDAREHYAPVIAAGIDGFKNTYPAPARDAQQARLTAELIDAPEVTR